jgi:uncharacterized protein (TIRG00374 family)
MPPPSSTPVEARIGAFAETLRVTGNGSADRPIHAGAARDETRGVTEQAAPSSSTAPPRRYVRSALAVLVTGLSLYLLLPSLAAVFSSWPSLLHLTWWWAAGLLVAEAASTVLLWQLDRIALKTQAWFPVASAQLSGAAVGRVLPGGGATAAAFTVGMLRKAGFEIGDATAGLGASTVLQLATSLALPIFALPAIAGGVPVPRGLATSAYLGLAVLLLLLAGGAVAFTTDRLLIVAGDALQWLLNSTVRRRRNVRDLSAHLLAARNFVRATLGDRWLAALVAAAASTGFDYLALLCALRAVGAEPRASLVVLAYTSAKLLALVPLTPGGLGFVEAGLVGTLTLAGVAAPDAVAATFAYRVASFWLPIPAGAGAYVLFRRRYG